MLMFIIYGQKPMVSMVKGLFGVFCIILEEILDYMDHCHLYRNEPIKTKQTLSNMIGIGIVPEGLNQNEIIYEILWIHARNEI